jgi:DNA-directed RNA polymerase subunit beta'
MGTLDRELTVSATASLGLHLATRAIPAERGPAVRDRDHLLELHARGVLALDDTVRIAGRTTTAGRHLVAACMPPAMSDEVEAPWDATRGARAIERIVRELHIEIAARSVAALEQLGRLVADRSGFSLASDDFLPPREARAMVHEAHERTVEIEEEYDEGMITDGERFNRVEETWAHAAALARLEARRWAPERDPLAACTASLFESAPPDAMRSLRGVIMVGARWGTGMIGTVGDGIGPHEYFMRAAETRNDLLDDAERRWRAYELARDVDAVIGDLEIVAIDCGTTRGIRVRALKHDDHIAVSLAARIEGRVAAEDVRDRDGALLASAGALLVPALARRIEAALVRSVVVRDVRACEARDGVCSRCFGLGAEDALWTCVGDSVGARATAAIELAVGRLTSGQIIHIC